VLVVDDAPLIVRMTTMLLTRKGHRVTTAVNGADALERILAGYREGSADSPVRMALACIELLSSVLISAHITARHAPV
jgi:CheY-like chemotaxis protein